MTTNASKGIPIDSWTWRETLIWEFPSIDYITLQHRKRHEMIKGRTCGNEPLLQLESGDHFISGQGQRRPLRVQNTEVPSQHGERGAKRQKKPWLTGGVWTETAGRGCRNDHLRTDRDGQWSLGRIILPRWVVHVEIPRELWQFPIPHIVMEGEENRIDRCRR